MATKSNPDETYAEQKARQKANSLKEQLQKFYKTGRVTKGMQRAGYANVAPQKYVAKTGDSPFSVARSLLGPNVSEQAVAAFVQNQGWSAFRSGATYNVRGAYVTPSASASAGYFENVLGIPQDQVFQNQGYDAGTTGAAPIVSALQPGAKSYTPGATVSGVKTTKPTVTTSASAAGYIAPYANVNAQKPTVGIGAGASGIVFKPASQYNNSNLPRPIANAQKAIANLIPQIRTANNERSATATPSTIAVTPTGSSERRFASGALANQYGLDQAVANFEAERAKATSDQQYLPTSINATVLSKLDPKFVQELLASPLYTQYPNGSIVLNVDAYNELLGITDINIGTGSGSGVGTTTGVYDYQRPRSNRGGVGSSGTRTYGGGGGGSYSADYSGGSIMSSWKIGF